MKGLRIPATLSTVLGILLVLVACAPAAQPAAAPAPAATAAPAAKPAPAAPTATVAPTGQPKYGGILTTYVAANLTSTLDPFFGSGQVPAVLAPTYNGLLRYDFVDNMTVVPDLAERWEVSPDGLTYTFYLRKDVRWHDGKPFGAWDVQFTYDRTLIKKELALSYLGRSMVDDLVSSWKTIDDYTFQITLGRPAPYFLKYMGANYNVRITAKHTYDAERGTVQPKEGQFQYGVGTGPFKIVKYEQGSGLEFVRNPDFFRKGFPYLDGIKRLDIVDRATQVAAMASGRVMINMIWPGQLRSEIKLIQETAKGKVHIVQAFQNSPQKINFQNGFPPMNDPKVRRAVFLAIDRWDISERVFEGAGEVGGILDSRIVGDWSLPREEVLKLPGIRKDKTEDIAEAKRLLAEAGYPNGFEVIWQVRNTAEYVPVAQVVAAQLEKIGIRSKIESLDPAAGTQITRAGKWHLNATGGSDGGYHPIAELRAWRNPRLPYANFNVKWIDSNPKFEAMYDESRTSLDALRVKQLAIEMQRYLLTVDAEYFPVVWIDSPMVVWNQVKNYYAPVYGMREGNDFTIVWLDQ